jgi:two-component system, LytTR family, response regulator
MNTQPLLSSYHSPSALPSPLPLNSIIIPNGNRQVIIQTDQLVCMEGCGNYAFLYTSDGKRHLVSKTLKSYAALLDQLSFVRVHKSWIINLKYLQDFCQYDRSLRLRGGREIAISRRRIREVSNILIPHVK